MSYKQASRSDLQRVVGGMVSEGLAETAQQVHDLEERVNRFGGAIGVDRIDIKNLQVGQNNMAKGQELSFKAIDDRFRAATDRHRQALQGISALGTRIDDMQKELGRMTKHMEDIDRAINAAARRMGEIESTLIRSREEAINKLAQTMSRAILSVLNETAGK